MKNNSVTSLVGVLCLWLLTVPLAPAIFAGGDTKLDQYLQNGRIREGLEYFSPRQDNNVNRFSLGVLQVLDGVLQFRSGFHKLGIKPELAQSGLPFFAWSR